MMFENLLTKSIFAGRGCFTSWKICICWRNSLEVSRVRNLKNYIRRPIWQNGLRRKKIYTKCLWQRKRKYATSCANMKKLLIVMVCRSDCAGVESDRRGKAEAAIAGFSEWCLKPVVSFRMRLAFVIVLFLLVAGIVVKLSRILVIIWSYNGEICNNS